MTLDELRTEAEKAEENVAELEAIERQLPAQQVQAIERGDTKQFWDMQKRLDGLPQELYVAKCAANRAAKNVLEAQIAENEAAMPPLEEQVKELQAQIAPLQARLSNAGSELYTKKQWQKTLIGQRRALQDKQDELDGAFRQMTRRSAAPVVRSLLHAQR